MNEKLGEDSKLGEDGGLKDPIDQMTKHGGTLTRALERVNFNKYLGRFTK